MLDRDRDEGTSIICLQAQGIATLVTGTVAETVLGTVRLPGGLLGPNFALEIYAMFTVTNNVNAKVARLRAGGLAGQSWGGYNQASTATMTIGGRIFGRGAENSQVALQSPNTPYGNPGSVFLFTNVDLTIDCDLVVTGQLANVGDSMTLDGMYAILMNKRIR